MALGLFVRVVAHCDISEDTNTAPLLVNLWNLSDKHSILDRKLMVSVVCGVLLSVDFQCRVRLVEL